MGATFPQGHSTVWGARGGSRNSLKGGGGSGPEFFDGGGGVRVQVRGNFHILTSKKTQKTTSGGGGLNPLTPPPLDPLLGATFSQGHSTLWGRTTFPQGHSTAWGLPFHKDTGADLGIL